jgi:hypothetical protein
MEVTMSTSDVPGHNPDNHDVLAMGCWAEHNDGSLILVENTEGSRVIYSVFDMSKEPPIEYRDAMPEASFKRTFSWDKREAGSERWTWHDKTQFPWDRLIKQGVTDGPRLPAAHHTLNAAERIVQTRQRHAREEENTAAERVADALRLRGQDLDRDNIDHRHEQVLSRVASVMEKLTSAISRMGRGRSQAKARDKGRRPPR